MKRQHSRARIARIMEDLRARSVRRRIGTAQTRGGRLAARGTPFAPRPPPFAARTGRFAASPRGLPCTVAAFRPRLRAMQVRWKRILAAFGLVAVAAGLALLESVQDHLARAGRPRDPFGFRIVNSLPPWLLVAVLAPAVAALVRRRPLAFEARRVGLHACAAALFAVAHMTLLALFNSFRAGAQP